MRQSKNKKAQQKREIPPINSYQRKRPKKSLAVWYILCGVLAIFIFGGFLFAMSYDEKSPSTSIKNNKKQPVKTEKNIAEESKNDKETPIIEDESLSTEKQPSKLIKKKMENTTNPQEKKSRQVPNNEANSNENNQRNHNRHDQNDNNNNNNNNNENGGNHGNGGNRPPPQDPSTEPPPNPPTNDNPPNPPDNDDEGPWWDDLFGW